MFAAATDKIYSGSASSIASFRTQTTISAITPPTTGQPPTSSCHDAVCILSSAINNPSPATTFQPDFQSPEGSTPTSFTVSTQTQESETPSTVAPAVVVFPDGSRTLSAMSLSGSGYIVDSTTLLPGQAMTLSDGHTISAAASVLMVDGTSIGQTSSVAPIEAVVTAGGQTITATQTATGIWAIASATVSSGEVVTLANGHIISFGSSGLDVDGSSVPLTTASARVGITGAVFTAGSDGQTYTFTHRLDGEYAAGSIAIGPGQTATLGNGVVVSVDSSELMLAESIIPVSALAVSTPTHTGAIYNIAGHTLTAGGIVALGTGTTLSLASNAATYYVNGAPVRITEGAPIDIASSTYSTMGTASTPSNSRPTAAVYSIAGHTLTAGGIVTMGSSTMLSLASNGATYFVDGVPTPIGVGGLITVAGSRYPPAATTTEMGNYIMSGLQPASSSTTSSDSRQTSSPTSNPGVSVSTNTSSAMPSTAAARRLRGLCTLSLAWTVSVCLLNR